MKKLLILLWCISPLFLIGQTQNLVMYEDLEDFIYDSAKSYGVAAIDIKEGQESSTLESTIGFFLGVEYIVTVYALNGDDVNAFNFTGKTDQDLNVELNTKGLKGFDSNSFIFINVVYKHPTQTNRYIINIVKITLKNDTGEIPSDYKRVIDSILDKYNIIK